MPNSGLGSIRASISLFISQSISQSIGKSAMIKKIMILDTAKKAAASTLSLATV